MGNEEDYASSHTSVVADDIAAEMESFLRMQDHADDEFQLNCCFRWNAEIPNSLVHTSPLAQHFPEDRIDYYERGCK